MSDLITVIPVDLKHDWVFEVDFQVVKARLIQVKNESFGTLSIGKRPEGPKAVGWTWKEIGGGGAGVIPWILLNDILYTGLIAQNRPTMGEGQKWQIPRGFVEPGLSHHESAQMEMKAETGIDPKDFLVHLPEEPQNPNSTFFDTSEGNGFEFYSFLVKRYYLKLDEEPICFRGGIFKPSDTTGERITDCRFFPWKKGATISDGFSNCAAARLLAANPILHRFIQ
jgi:8-oxo-dGTP pyrophosphatase MutT (NUDIX family)